MTQFKKLGALFVAVAITHGSSSLNSCNAVTITVPIVESAVVSFSCDAGAGQLVTVQSSSSFPFEWSDASYKVGTGAQLRFSQPLASGPQFFRVRVTPFQPLHLEPSSPVLAAGPVSLPDAMVREAYLVQVAPTLTGLPPYNLSVNGVHPSGVALMLTNNGTANAAVQVTSNGAGLVAGERQQFDVTVVDAMNTTNTLTYDLRVVMAPPQILTTLLVLKAGESFTNAVMATNGTPPLVWTNLAGSLPAGVILTEDGTLSGTPTFDDAELNETGRFTNVLQLADSYTDRVTGAPAPRVTTNSVVELVRLSYVGNIWPPRPDGPNLNGICLFCHGSGFPPNLAVPNATSIINVPSQAQSCPGRIYVTPASPTNSLIFEKLAGPDCGARMPYGGPYFDPTQLGRVKRWIQELTPGDTD